MNSLVFGSLPQYLQCADCTSGSIDPARERAGRRCRGIRTVVVLSARIRGQRRCSQPRSYLFEAGAQFLSHGAREKFGRSRQTEAERNNAREIRARLRSFNWKFRRETDSLRPRRWREGASAARWLAHGVLVREASSAASLWAHTGSARSRNAATKPSATPRRTYPDNPNCP